jgi:OmpA-OmpF porin, OOP family
MKRIGTLVSGACIAAFASLASAGAPEGSWYVAPQVHAVWLDDARNADDDAGGSLAVGRVLNHSWDVELGYYGSEHDRADGQTELQGFSLAVKWVFYREGRVSPFINLGVARQRTILKPGEDRADPAGLYGLGILIDLGPVRDSGSLFQLRGDLGARHAFSSGSDPVQDPIDYVGAIGFQYSWGGAVPRKVVDSDGDGVTDDLDRCPGTPSGTPVDSNGCPLDDDGDGVTNDADKCPNTPPGTKVDAKGCELDGDGDGDGILDSQDKCPDTPKGERVDATGCPFNKELLLQGVKFATNSADLLPESIPVLDRAIATLKRYPEVNVEVAGHTDSRGADAYNEQLSARRAASVLEYLKNGGVTNTLTSRGYGEREPIASNDTDEGRLQNRRVVLRVLN